MYRTLVDDPPLATASSRISSTERARRRRRDAGQDRRMVSACPEKGRADVLVFLSGREGIKESHEALASRPVARRLHIIPLYARLARKSRKGLRAGAPGSRSRWCISTNIAETIVTIEGISSVIDSGLAKLELLQSQDLHLEPRSRRRSKASVHQRKGRAGRTGRAPATACTQGGFRGQAPLHARRDLSHGPERSAASHGGARDRGVRAFRFHLGPLQAGKIRGRRSLKAPGRHASRTSAFEGRQDDVRLPPAPPPLAHHRRGDPLLSRRDRRSADSRRLPVDHEPLHPPSRRGDGGRRAHHAFRDPRGTSSPT